MPVEALITRDGPVNAPLDYDVPAASELVPLVISATFADPTNAGPYVPAVEVVTPQGVIIGPFPLAQSIAAGASARVSWFRGVSGSPSFFPNTGGTWISYTPVWTEKTGTQPSLGNGTLTGLYYQQAKYVIARIVLTAGTTTTFGNSGSTWLFSLPVPAIAAFNSYGLASNSADPTVGDIITWGYASDSTHIAAWGYGPTTAGKLIQFLNSAQPTAWGAGSVIRLACLYEAA